MNKWMSILVLTTSILLLGCSQEPPKKMDMEINVTNGSVSIQRIMVFEDDLAYGGKRGIYIIKDHATNKEFIGVSGIGISAIGAHVERIGKTPILTENER